MMTKLNDYALNKLLGGVGQMPALVSEVSKKKMKPLVSSSLYEGKGLVKGARYLNSPYETVTTLMKRVSDEAIKKPVNEIEGGLLKEAIQLISYAKEEGVELPYEVPTFQEASRALEERARLGLNSEPQNPVELLVEYRTAIHLANKPIEEMKDSLLDKIEEDMRAGFLSRSKFSLEWAIKKSGVGREVVDEAAKLQAEKDIVLAKYQAIAERFNYGGGSFFSALLVAKLYVMNIQKEQNRRSKLRRDVFEAISNKYVEKMGHLPTGDMLTEINKVVEKKVKEYSDTGFSSIQTLFPAGSIQFLEWIDNEAIKTKREAGKHVYVYLQSDHVLSEEEKAFWRNLQFQKVTMTDGMLYGLTVDKGERLNTKEGDFASVQEKEIAHLDEGLQSFLRKNKFLRGAKFWTGGKQEATVLLATPYQKGVRVYLGGLRYV